MERLREEERRWLKRETVERKNEGRDDRGGGQRRGCVVTLTDSIFKNPPFYIFTPCWQMCCLHHKLWSQPFVSALLEWNSCLSNVLVEKSRSIIIEFKINVLYLTQSAISEELNVVSQTELRHLCCRSLVNHRVLHLHVRHIKSKHVVDRCTEAEGERHQSDAVLH